MRTPATETLTSVELTILRELQQNAKLSVRELAERVHLSASPTFERIKRLEREGYIERYAAIINTQKLGMGFIVWVNIRLKKHGKEIGEQFMEAIRGIDEITECYNTSGDYDFMMKVYARDMAHYQDFVLNTLGVIDSIGQLHSIFVIGEVKNSHAVPLPAL